MLKFLPLLFSVFVMALFMGCEKEEEPSKVEITANQIKGTWELNWSKLIQYDEDGRVIHSNEGSGSMIYTFDDTKINIEGILLDFPYTLEEKNGKVYIIAFDEKNEIVEMTPEKMSWFDIVTRPGSGRIVTYMDFTKLQ